MQVTKTHNDKHLYASRVKVNEKEKILIRIMFTRHYNGINAYRAFTGGGIMEVLSPLDFKNVCVCGPLQYFYLSSFWVSSKSLGFTFPATRPRCWAVTSFCVQFENWLESAREYKLVRERVLSWYMGGRYKRKIHYIVGVHRVCWTYTLPLISTSHIPKNHPLPY